MTLAALASILQLSEAARRGAGRFSRRALCARACEAGAVLDYPVFDDAAVFGRHARASFVNGCRHDMLAMAALNPMTDGAGAGNA